ncbi:hypothetical protein BJX68DRAFT_198670 [Aspergillus pseudodeflectus]|uniref:Uncharacterized protein n=1 Tax=Aspergillus pseudodeflectus TaxID=176178 RepID=A0ABR4JGX7_9EURO
MTPDNTSKDAPGASTSQNAAAPDSTTGPILALFKEVKDIAETLNSIKSELARHSEQLSRLDHSSTAKEAILEFPPRESDWDARELHAWYQSLVPDEPRLQTMGELIRGALYATSKHTDIVQISATPIAVAQGVIESTHPVLLALTDGIERLMHAWPRKLMANVEESGDCPISDEDSVYFNWLFPYSSRVSLEIASLEMQYNSQGDPVVRDKRHKDGHLLQEFIFKKQPNTAIDNPWLESLYGRILRHIEVWRVDVLPVQAIAFILWQLHHPDVTNYTTNPGFGTVWTIERSGVLFVLGYASSWGQLDNISCCKAFSPGELLLVFQVRWMDMDDADEEIDRRSRGNPHETGLRLERGHAVIPYTTSAGNDREFQLSEMRHALAARTTTHTRLPQYTIVTLLDNEAGYAHDSNYPANGLRKRLQSSRCGSLTGVAVFLAEVSLGLEIIAKKWSCSLDNLDSRFGISLERLTPDRRRELMFDSGDFSKSEEYFTILQALRLCRNWVSETVRDVKSIAEKAHEVIDSMREGMTEDNLVERSQELQQLDKILARLVADSEALFQPLLDRIERNNEEIKSLRDGLFNATSVREASRGTSLAENSALQNRYILVFTVATIFYLPMSFVTSFYGMHLFDPGDESSASRTPFIITFIVISVGTYVVAAGALWLVRYREVIKKLLAPWRELIPTF